MTYVKQQMLGIELLAMEAVSRLRRQDLTAKMHFRKF